MDKNASFIVAQLRSIAEVEVAGKQIAKEFDAPNYTTGELIVEIDQIYLKAENVIIPLVYACRVAIAIFNGATMQGTEESTLSVLRRLYRSDSSTQ